MSQLPKKLAGFLIVILILFFALNAGDYLGARFTEGVNRPIVALPSAQIKRNTVNSIDAKKVRTLYVGWKKAHSGNIEQLMIYYAPQVRIVREAGNVENLQQFKYLAVLVRRQNTFNSVRDLSPITLKSDGGDIVLQAIHRYGHSSEKLQPLKGLRTLVWQKIDGQWLIIKDIFPPNYTTTK